ncbi:DUF1549 domain-containing protein [Fimbriiglobus ruber]|uniref:S-layer protein n=1 Tax=Fimbriiglobus ruber TaxID=1908690 RepID=A0A225EBP0_9BACT|nr:DUF1549 domain-containing protein [Fimbriiglobus ruber]OWK46769.1 hypothetical protein FRUB_00468 [Fimbriiglobus ruber]
MIRASIVLAAFAAVITPAISRAAPIVTPAVVRLDSPESTQQILVTGTGVGGRPIDLTRTVTYEVANPAIATIDPTGLLAPRADGRTELVVIAGADRVRVPIEVSGFATLRPVSFENDVIPLLTKATCNAGGCHGKAEGQNGFKLSVFGFDPVADHAAVVMEARGRRVFVAAPESSLLLLKGAGRVPHGGGKKLDEGTPRYRRLARWVAEGAAYGRGDAPPVVSLEVEPAQRLLALSGTQQIRVTAVDAAGGRRCVSAEAEYDSNAPSIAVVDRRGWVRASDIPGESAILVRYHGHVAVSRLTLPRPGVTFPRPAEANFVDRRVWDKLEQLGIPPSGLADDAEFLRRVYLDTIGTMPTPDEARTFFAAADPNKRAKLIDQLLDRPEYADYWAMKWADLLRVDRDAVNPKAAIAMTRWVRKQFAENRPFDQFARDILTARGNTAKEGPAAVYVVMSTPEELGRSMAQLFCGVRLACAQCHHHPSDRWGQDDYFALAGFFSGVTRKTIPGGGTAVTNGSGGDLKNPRTNTVVPTRALGAAAVAKFDGVVDRRNTLADWLSAPDNPYFAPAVANRIWAHYFGRGLVEPVDDIRPTNPATNEPLLADLAAHLRDGKYNLKAFTRTLLNSRTYQLTSRPLPGNADDAQNFSHAAAKALPAEVLLDAISRATGVPEKFNGWPEGYRAIELWDNRVPSYFFRIFGRPLRASVCECERSNEPSITQALHLMNSPEIAEKIRAKTGTARKLADSAKPPAEIVNELYLTALARLPTDQERLQMLKVFAEAGPDRRAATEDVLWALLNTKEFLYNH